MAYTRGQFRTLLRQYLDLENTTSQQDSELNNAVNSAVAYGHDFLIATLKQHYATASATLTTVSGTKKYTLTSGFPDLYRPFAVRLPFDDLSIPLDGFQPQDRIKITSPFSWGPGALPKFYFALSAAGVWTVEFDPPPDTGIVVTIEYHTTPPVYTSDSDVVAFPYPDLIRVEAARIARAKEQVDLTDILQERAAIQKRIEDWVGTVDMAQPMTTLRVRRQLELGRRARAF